MEWIFAEGYMRKVERDVNRVIMGMRKGDWKFVDDGGKIELKEREGKEKKFNGRDLALKYQLGMYFEWCVSESLEALSEVDSRINYIN